jgi:N-acetylmuramoyl-L-alanine amidase
MLNSLKFIAAVFAFGASVAFVSKPLTQEVAQEASKPKVGVVVIDAGHGGQDHGTHGKIAKEKHVALKIALELGKKIKAESPEVKVLYTRTSDVFIELNERSAFANRNKADLFISIHCNFAPKASTVKGTETFVMGLHKTEGNLEVAKRENAVILQEENYKQQYKGFDPESPLAHIMLANYQSAFLSNSLSLASKIEGQFRSYASRSSRGVKQAGFLVLWKAAMPSVLIETGFMSNAEEERFLASDEGQDKIAESIARAFQQYKEEMERY